MHCDTDLDRRQSVTWYVFQVGGNTNSWRLGLQHMVSLSTTKSKYMAPTKYFKEDLWLKGMVSDLGMMPNDAKVLSNSQNTIHLATKA